MADETIQLQQRLEQCTQELRASKERFRNVISKSADGVLVVDNAGIVRFANPAAEALFGRRGEELGGAPFGFPIVTGEITEIDIIPKQGQPVVAEMRVVETAWEGEMAYLVSLRDITERRHAEDQRSQLIREQAARAEAESAQQQVASILESITDGFMALDQQWRFTYMNKEAEERLQRTRGEIIGKNIWEELPELVDTRFAEQYHRAVAEQVTVEFTEFYPPLGLWFEIRAYPSKVGLSIYFRDITRRNRAEELSSHLAAIVESSDDAIISKSLEGIILSWNKGAERIFGYTAEEIIGQPILMLIPPDRIDEEPAILERLKRGERIDHYETIRVTRDGRALDISLTISPIKDASDNIIAASKIARDITERKQTEARLREQAEIIETINRTGQLLSAELDLQKLVQTVTDAATELCGARFGSFFYNVYDDQGGSYMLYTLSGVPREAFAHFPMPRATDLFGPTFRGEGTICIDDVKQDSRYGKNSPYYGMPPGHLPVTSYLAVPVFSRSGEVIGGLFFGHPSAGVFTERAARLVEGLAAQAAIAMDNARLYQNVQQSLAEREALLHREQAARQQAEVASRTKDEFLATVSHELRTPLNAILGWTRLLTDHKLDEEMLSRAIETIDRNAHLQTRLIEDMLDVSRIISGKLRLDAQPVDLSGVIYAAADTLRSAAEAKEIRIDIVLAYGTGMVLGDPVRLQQIIWNLLANAIKFSPKKGRVQIQLQRINSSFEITVSDTGPGIDQEFLPYVFDRFRQADSSTSRKYGGLGLGLAIVRHLVDLHGGTAEAANRAEGHGAVFTITLPVMAVRKQTGSLAGQIDEAYPGVSRSQPFDRPPSLDGLKVLAVDDDADARQLLTAMLEQCGAEVKTSSSTAEALAALTQFMPDVLVSDIGMPEEDGFVLIEKLRALEPERGGRIPAIALTAYARAEDRLHVLAGYNMHVPKPVDPAELAIVIASLTGRSRKR
jgi:PAS domain S-box-containing protein